VGVEFDELVGGVAEFAAGRVIPGHRPYTDAAELQRPDRRQYGSYLTANRSSASRIRSNMVSLPLCPASSTMTSSASGQARASTQAVSVGSSGRVGRGSARRRFRPGAVRRAAAGRRKAMRHGRSSSGRRGGRWPAGRPGAESRTPLASRWARGPGARPCPAGSAVVGGGAVPGALGAGVLVGVGPLRRRRDRRRGIGDHLLRPPARGADRVGLRVARGRRRTARARRADGRVRFRAAGHVTQTHGDHWFRDEFRDRADAGATAGDADD